MRGGISKSLVAKPGPEISRNSFEPSNFLHKDKTTKIRINKRRADLKRRRNNLSFDMHLSMISSKVQSTCPVPKSSKSRSITIYLVFACACRQFGVPISRCSFPLR